jgi:hypothetical protein
VQRIKPDYSTTLLPGFIGWRQHKGFYARLLRVHRLMIRLAALTIHAASQIITE